MNEYDVFIGQLVMKVFAENEEDALKEALSKLRDIARVCEVDA